MAKKLLLIFGRTGSGKDTYAGFLEAMGLKGVKSYTTRPKRTEDEDTHIFITKEEAALFKNRVATTEINGYEYFATKEQIDDADYYIIDPAGVTYMLSKYPDINYKLIYIYAERGTRLERAVKRGNAEREAEIFKQRDKLECEQFSPFEDDISEFLLDDVIIHNNTKAKMDDIKEWAKEDAMSCIVSNLLAETYTNSASKCFNAMNQLKRTVERL